MSSFEEDVKKILLAGIGAVAVTAEKAEALVGEFIEKGQITVEQGKVLNEELSRRLGKAVEDVKSDLSGQVKPAVDVEKLSPEEREELRRRLDELDARENG